MLDAAPGAPRLRGTRVVLGIRPEDMEDAAIAARVAAASSRLSVAWTSARTWVPRCTSHFNVAADPVETDGGHGGPCHRGRRGRGGADSPRSERGVAGRPSSPGWTGRRARASASRSSSRSTSRGSISSTPRRGSRRRRAVTPGVKVDPAPRTPCPNAPACRIFGWAVEGFEPSTLGFKSPLLYQLS